SASTNYSLALSLTNNHEGFIIVLLPCHHYSNMPRSPHHHNPGFDCLSWRLAVETNNMREWSVVPQACVSYVGHYMLGYQYRKDVQAVADLAYNFAKTVPLPKDLRTNLWIFELLILCCLTCLIMLNLMLLLAESLREVTTKNLKNLGFTTWEKLILKQTSDAGTSSQIYKEKKRNELLAKGHYRIVGNVGDQWSDLVGEHVGYRTFKVPNPMYYIS
ncbi:acid phosphatase 1, partial [Quercus suber]